MLAQNVIAIQGTHYGQVTPAYHAPQRKTAFYQRTVLGPIRFEGVGIHSGDMVTMTIKPAPINTGYVFIRTDLSENNLIHALWSNVVDTSMSTRIANEHGISVGTIEHIIAALAGMQIHNAIIEINAPEVPIMDGSSLEFVKKLQHIGVKTQPARVHTIRVLKPIQVSHGQSTAFLLPCDEPRISMDFNFNNRFNDISHFSFDPDTDNFTDLLSAARTFGLYEDAQKLRAAGLAKGASLQNTVVIGEGGVMNEGGLRYDDEFVRHKVLDAVGDLALAGARLLAHFDGTNSGHALNNKILRTLFNDPAAWVIEEINENHLSRCES